MLIIYHYAGLGPRMTLEFNLPGAIPELNWSSIEYIEATGNELNVIRNLFADGPRVDQKDYAYTIPITHYLKDRCIWYGDLARMILLNL